MADTCARPDGILLECKLHLPTVTAQDFLRVKQLVLGRRCRFLKQIEKASGATVTLYLGYDSCLAVRGSLEALREAVRLLINLLGNVLKQQVAWPQHAEIVGRPGEKLEEYLTEAEMEAVLARMGYPEPASIVSQMRADGLPFGDRPVLQEQMDQEATAGFKCQGASVPFSCHVDIEESIVGGDVLKGDVDCSPHCPPHCFLGVQPRQMVWQMLPTPDRVGVEESTTTSGSSGSCLPLQRQDDCEAKLVSCPMLSSPLEQLD